MVVGRMWFFAIASNRECPTPRAADTAAPWARRGGWSGEEASPAVVVGRRRRAADALVGWLDLGGVRFLL